ncbi:TIR domain-containing protein [Streptomyces sp. NPDC005760]|uniref:toll/interleukin-1 receptor domain-containing protein n=1 Tax=Streptomyces sp. NPDC005760 TaxID=3156718 RepID=UPI0033F329D1
MKVFISWSGSLSGAVAKSLSNWLTPVLQSVDFWVSSHDISVGQRWFDRISRELDDTDFGLVCLTRKNVNAPWINFEAGALAKAIETSRVVPIFINLKDSDVGGPLNNFQGVSPDRQGILTLVQDINSVTGRSVPPGPLEDLFNVMWPRLDKELARYRKELKDEEEDAGPARSLEDMLSETLNRLRHLEARVAEEGRRPKLRTKEERVADEASRILVRRMRESGPPATPEEWRNMVDALEWTLLSPRSEVRWRRSAPDDA